MRDELERLRVAEAVRALLWRYTTAIDSERSVDQVADAFVADAVLLNHDRFEGLSAISSYYADVLASLEVSRHHITNSIIECESPTRARHHGTFLAVIKRDGKTSLLSGDYDDIVVKCPDGLWRFQQKGNYIRVSQPMPSE
jgi:hypothetical protein